MLSGVNAKCRQCKRECKQWQQVVVVSCKKFVSVMSNVKLDDPVNREKRQNPALKH